MRAKKAPLTPDMFKCDFALAIVKGLIEHNDGGAYFGSLMGYRHHEADGIKRGLLTRGPKQIDMGGGHMETIEATRLTDAGRKEYDARCLHRLPTHYGSRAYMWKWNVIEPEVVSPEKASK